MDPFLFLVTVLFILAAVDLTVGVSNDAVNFLNSAVGSRAASRRTLLIIASIGVFAGALFAGGMMEVARKGIFNPQFFTFAEVMVIFLAVMFTDIVLLDFFNTFGLPTSTTVSIVFELLGAAVAVAAFKLMANGEGFANLGQYINSGSSLTIISGIFISVGVAFTAGVIVQYFVRLIFTFEYEQRLQTAGVIWSGIALAGISYFLLFKGVKGAPFISADFLHWIEARTLGFMIGAFLFWAVIMFVLFRFFKINILRIIVLAGTFSLAMAFASNDLVNFIGPSIAGYESYLDWVKSGVSADSYLMTSLAAGYPPSTYLLFPAGLIMLLTLWFSKKARTVTETEVNLGRQSEGLERFPANPLARALVRFGANIGNNTGNILPTNWKEKIENRFQNLPFVQVKPEDGEPPAFDLVRASVNLTLSSILIAFATSMKLPLSTTYVTFMVAMGTSLSDRAWGRDSAVFRVAGVLNVLMGWFMTAFIAFTVSVIFALVMQKLGIGGIVLLIVLSVLSFWYTIVLHGRREKVKEKILAATRKADMVTAVQIIEDTAADIANGMDAVRAAYRSSIEGLEKEDIRKLREAEEAMKKLKEANEEFKYTFYGAIRRINEEIAEGSRTYLLTYDLQQDFVQSATFIAEAARQHVEDVLQPLASEQLAELQIITNQLDTYLQTCTYVLRTRDFDFFTQIKEEKKSMMERIERLLAQQAKGIKQQIYSARNSILFFSLMLETKDIISVAAQFVKLYRKLELEHTPASPWVLLTDREE